MEGTEMIVMIVFLSIVGGIINNMIKQGKGFNFKDWDWDLDDLWDDDDDDHSYKKSQKKIVRQQQQLLSQVETKYEEKISGLEERIKVLEAIVTDSKYDLKAEFEKLNAS